MDVPPVLLGGSHAAIEAWKAERRLARTAARRPDLLPALNLAAEREVRIPNIGRMRDFRWPDDLPSVRALFEDTGLELGPLDAPAELAKLMERNPGLAWWRRPARRSRSSWEPFLRAGMVG